MKCLTCGIDSDNQKLCIFCREVPLEDHISKLDQQIKVLENVKRELGCPSGEGFEARARRAEFLAYKHTCWECPDRDTPDCIDVCESRYLKFKGPYFDYAEAFKQCYHSLSPEMRNHANKKFSIKLSDNGIDIINEKGEVV